MKIAYSFGIIDLLHIGHINVLREAKQHACLHVFGLVEDEAAREWMGGLLSSCEERRRVLEQISCIDEIVNQKTFDPNDVTAAIEGVLSSYRRDNLLGESEQVLIQRQTEDVTAGGVIFTRDLQRNRPYYLVNYEDNGSTDAVTSGSGGKSLWISRDTETRTLAEPWRSLIEAIREIERILDGMILDIEFAITGTGEVVIFQVRPLAANYRYAKEFDDEAFYAHKQRVKAAIRSQNAGMDQEAMIFSDMAFWNPSEMIGVHPHELDYSLYREIITRRAWNEGLVPMGYRRVDRELMVRFSGKPYISVDYAFESLIPAVLPDELSRKLVHFYRRKLTEDLTAHDKIEFEIVYSCYDFSTADRLDRLTDEGFYIEECQSLRRALRDLTLRGLRTYSETLARDENALERLAHSRRQIERKLCCQEENTTALLRYFTVLIGGIKQNGTPQFARQARYAFIARSLCNSLVERGYVTRREMDNFMGSMETVSTGFARDLDRYLDGTLPREEFCERYGHLRSGTYDIRAPRYDQLNFQPRRNRQKPEPVKPAAGLPSEALERALTEAGFDGVTPEELTKFIRSSIEQRERFKFEFTRSLSLALEVLRIAGRNLGIEAAELSFLQMADILAAEYYGSGTELAAFWRALIRRRQELRENDALLVLPDVLTGAEDVDVVCMQEARPNFITEKAVTGTVVVPGQIGSGELAGKIVLLEKADPGYDWIFSQNIAGLITCYGGAASHMAIRCAEFGIPAAIGCGKKIYAYAGGLETVLLDAGHGKIKEADPCAR